MFSLFFHLGNVINVPFSFFSLGDASWTWISVWAMKVSWRGVFLLSLGTSLTFLFLFFSLGDAFWTWISAWAMKVSWGCFFFFGVLFGLCFLFGLCRYVVGVFFFVIWNVINVSFSFFSLGGASLTWI